jgi:hypothetical protein
MTIIIWGINVGFLIQGKFFPLLQTISDYKTDMGWYQVLRRCLLNFNHLWSSPLILSIAPRRTATHWRL